jgi:hypothetical protein
MAVSSNKNDRTIGTLMVLGTLLLLVVDGNADGGGSVPVSTNDAICDVHSHVWMDECWIDSCYTLIIHRQIHTYTCTHMMSDQE